MRLEGKTAIITGAASGMGTEEARLFAREGCKVVVSDISDDLGNQVVEQIKQSGGDARFIYTDVTSEESWDGLINETLATFGAINILVNNAGLSGSYVTDDNNLEAWHALVNVNLTGVYLGTRAVLPVMKKAGGGSIVNISSASGLFGSTFGHPGYHASKGGVRIFTKAIAFKHGPAGIRVNSVHPGYMPPMKSANPASSSGGRLVGYTPLRRRGETADVANAVLFLASDDASFITGAELVVDGGLTAGYGRYPDPSE